MADELDNLEIVDGDGEGAQVGDGTESPMHQELVKQAQEVGARGVMARLLADPEYAEVARAKESKKKFKIVYEDGPQQQSVAGGQPGQQTATQLVAPAQPDFSKMNTAQIAQWMKQQINEGVDQALQQKLEPLQQQQQQLTGYVQSQQTQAAQKSLADVRSEFPDVDRMIPEMRQLSEQAPALSMKELYILAKTRKGEPIGGPKPTSTEWPTSSSARPGVVGQRQKKQLPPGNAGIRVALDQALDRGLQGIDFEG